MPFLSEKGEWRGGLKGGINHGWAQRRRVSFELEKYDNFVICKVVQYARGYLRIVGGTIGSLGEYNIGGLAILACKSVQKNRELGKASLGSELSYWGFAAVLAVSGEPFLRSHGVSDFPGRLRGSRRLLGFSQRP